MHQFHGGGRRFLHFICLNMIDKHLLTQEIEKDLEDTDLFLVDLSVSSDNRIVVEIDSCRGVDIEDCTRLTQQIEAAFDRDVEDYDSRGSAGLTSPFKVKGQYEKNIGNEIEVLTRDGRKITGTLQSVSPDGAAFTMTVKEKVKEEGKKRPVIVDRSVEMNVADTRSVRYLLSFK